VATYLEENPHLAKEIEDKIRAQLLGGATPILASAGANEEDDGEFE
jgi:hypothetical protein